MNNVFIINAHQPSEFAAGKLNATLVELAAEVLGDKGYALKQTASADGYDIAAELDKHRWADVVIVQSPVNWMGVPWSFKKYMDDVYTAGMNGELCDGDGRTRSDPDKQYGSGGTLSGKKYMLSLTFNAPAAAFNDKQQYLFGGRSIDDLFFPMHMNFRFFNMEPLDTFACMDVVKSPTIDDDFERFTAHLDRLF